MVRLFGNDIISIAESTIMAEVGTYIENHIWNFPTSNHTFINDLRRRVSSVQIHRSDSVRGDGLQASQIKISTIWNTIRDSGNSPPWLKAVRHQLSIPKCSFALWLALKNRLLRRERMIQFRMNVDPVCLLCNTANETY